MSTQQSIETGSAKRVLCALLLCGAAFFSAVSSGLGATAPTNALPQTPYQGLFLSPTRLALATNGNLYVTDSRAGKLFMLNTTGAVVTVTNNLNKPLAVAVGNQGLVYVSEEGAGRVRVFNSTLTSSPSSLGVGSNEFNLANHIAVDTTKSNGWIYVSDSRANEIRCYTNSALVKKFGTKGSGTNQFDFPAGLYFSTNQELFVVDQNNDRVQVFNSTGAYKRVFSLRVPAKDLVVTNIYGRPQGITGDNEGRIYVTDAYQGEVKVFDAVNTNYLATISSMGEWLGQLRTPGSVALGTDKRLFVASLSNNRIEIFSFQDSGSGSVLVTLQIISPPYSSPVPAVGTYTNTSGATLTNSVATPIISGIQTQYVCTGWTLTGNFPASGTTNWMTLTHTNNAVLAWNWKTQYILSVTAGANGNVSASNSFGNVSSSNVWCDAGTTGTVKATTDTYYQFSQWTGSSTSTTNPLSVAMTSPKSYSASFAAILATNSTPEWWLAQYPTLTGTNMNAKAMGDQDADGVPTWQEYDADTIPTNSLSYLGFSNLTYMALGPKVELIWHGGGQVTQFLDRASSLAGTPVWTNLLIKPPPTPISITYTNQPGTNAAGFYRIRVNPR
ncbi:MAG: hypothetical protein WCK89_06790 [bacterium]